ncbi:MAG TPA: FxsA family protein [Thermoleophilaceae bacterium]|nr:FxsA family protein [Thermoleophilaceae bacterium]
MPILALVLLFLVVPLAELYVILKVGDAIGVLWTILILVADSLLGSLLMRSQGRAVWRRFNEALQAGRMPHREVQHGVAVIFGGALLLTPGFLTDILGLALLLPPTRAVIVRLAERTAARRMASAAGERARRPQRSYDVEGSASEHPQPPTGPRRLDR